jgi:hypothetical protein
MFPPGHTPMAARGGGAAAAAAAPAAGGSRGAARDAATSEATARLGADAQDLVPMLARVLAAGAHGVAVTDLPGPMTVLLTNLERLVELVRGWRVFRWHFAGARGRG